jgi:hypothetical protein
MGLNGMNTYRQDDLLAELVKMFPQFRAVWEEENGDEEFRSSSLHSVYMSFLPFVAVAQPTQKQWQLLADHLSEAVASGGDRENAADTCFLEHLHQLRLNKILRPLLSKAALAYVRA